MESTDKFDFVSNKMERIILKDAYEAVEDMNLWNYLKENTFESFTYYNGPNKQLHEDLLEKADKSNIHSGASYGITMRNMESIAKQGFDVWKKEYLNNSFSS